MSEGCLFVCVCVCICKKEGDLSLESCNLQEANCLCPLIHEHMQSRVTVRLCHAHVLSDLVCIRLVTEVDRLVTEVNRLELLCWPVFCAILLLAGPVIALDIIHY